MCLPSQHPLNTLQHPRCTHLISMIYDPINHHRRSIRLKNYDYRQQGAYFVTICTQGRLCHFGEVEFSKEGACVHLNAAGEMVNQAWLDLVLRCEGIELDSFVVMPNHLHGVLVLPPQSLFSLSDVVHDFKSWTTTLYCRGVHQGTWPPFEKRCWHRNYSGTHRSGRSRPLSHPALHRKQSRPMAGRQIESN